MTIQLKVPGHIHSITPKLSDQVLRNPDFLCIGAIVAVIFSRFFSTIFLHKSISKLYLIALWDSLFYPLRSGQSFNMDPSLVLQHLPQRFLVADLWHHTIPLWNPFAGFGVPLLADPNAFAFSPLFALFAAFPSMYIWNITIVLLLFTGAISTYFLCRELDLKPLGSLVASLLFTFCPSTQSQTEQVYASCLIPLVFFFFVRVAKRNSIWSAVLAGLAAGVDLLSANPESAFVTIIFATILMFLSAYYNDRSGFNFISLVGKLALSGIVAFGISAPLLIPFGEYLLRCESYKFNDTPDCFSLQGIFTNLLFPFYTRNNLFWGPLSWWGISAILWLPNKSNASRFAWPLVICLAVSIFAIAQLFPLNMLFRIPPFSMVLVHYYVLPQYIFFLSVISGLGIALLFDAIRNKSVRKTVVVGLGLTPVVLSLTLSPLAASVWPNALTLPYALTIEYPDFQWTTALINASCTVAMLLALVATSNRASKLQTLGFIGFLIIGMSDLLMISYKALPVRPSFKYPHSLTLDTSRTDGRFLSIGDHLFRPNTYVVYKLPMILEWNAFHPKGFNDLMRACGACVDKFGQYYPPTISRLLDLTGTRTIISQQPVLDEAVIASTNAQPASYGQADYGTLLTLRNLQLLHDPKAKTVFCRFDIDPHVAGFAAWHIHLDFLDKDNKTILYAEPQSVSASLGNQSITCSSFLPADAREWSLSVRLISDTDCQVVPPNKVPIGRICPDGSWRLATSQNLSSFRVINNDRFKLLSNQQGILTYENKSALDRCFFVRELKWMKQREAIFDYLKLHTSTLSHVALLDETQKEQFEKLFGALAPAKSKSTSEVFDASASITKTRTPRETSNVFDPSSTIFQTKASQPALLVVSDLYYPGWKALVDGAESPIFCADCLFRAILIPPGVHTVEFKYQPLSFAIGIALFALTVSSILISLIALRIRQKRPQIL